MDATLESITSIGILKDFAAVLAISKVPLNALLRVKTISSLKPRLAAVS